MAISKIKPDENFREDILNPASTFRVNALGRIIANDLNVQEDTLWWLVLIEPDINPETSEPYSINQLSDFARELEIPGELSDFLAIPGEYSKPFRDESPSGPITLYARRSYVNAANSQKNKAGIKWLEVGSAFRDQDLNSNSAPFAPPETDTIEVPKCSVVMAVIDSGMGVGHELFRSTDCDGNVESRVAYFWDMDGSGVDTSTLDPTWTEPTSYGIGWTQKGLTEALRDNMHAGILDDAAFYAAIGSTDWGTRRHTPIAHRLSHGTHVMGLCAGYPTNFRDMSKVPGERPIIAVNLRSDDVEDPSGNLFIFSLERALSYILERYKRFVIKDGCGARPPLVINFSFGNFAGPHDGTGLIESQIDDALNKARLLEPNCQFILPAGNGNDSRCHAQIVLTDAEPARTLNCQVQPSDRSISEVEVWLDAEGTGQNVSLTVQGPGNLAPVSVNSQFLLDFALLPNADGDSIGILYYLSPILTPFKRGFFGVLLYPTSHPSDLGPFAPAGKWELTVAAETNGENIGINAWIERDETLPGFFEFGRQSYFNDPEYARYYEPGVDASPLDERLIGGPLGYDPINSAALVRREGTLSGFAGGDETINISAFVNTPKVRDAPLALYSSTGLKLDGKNVFPDASARSDDSLVMRGVLSAGSSSGSYLAMNGTSVSAPQVARWVANALSVGNPGGPVAVQNAASAEDPTGAGNPRKPPMNRSGQGRLLSLGNLFGPPR